MDLFGGSYGSRVAQVFMRRHLEVRGGVPGLEAIDPSCVSEAPAPEFRLP